MAGWSHNSAYHGEVLRAVAGAGRVLDVGCGQGELVRKLRAVCGEVVGIDRVVPGEVVGDFLEYPFAEGEFDAVVMVAVLHHLPVVEALRRIRWLVRAGGTVVIVGLYREETVLDWAWSAFAWPVSRVMKVVRGSGEGRAPVAPVREGLRGLRRVFAREMPGGVVRRRLFFRYRFVWKDDKRC